MKFLLKLLVFMSLTSAVQAEPLVEAEKYLNAIKTIQAQFQQITPEQNLVLSGDFYWQRPGYFRWRYAPPEGPELISNDLGWFYNDPQGAVTQLPKGTGWAKFLMLNQFDFSDEKMPFEVKGVMTSGRQFEIQLAPKEGDGGALGVQEMSLGFKTNPTALHRLVTVDQLGQRTMVLFKDVQANASLPANIFDFEPAHYQQDLLD
jgi:outer membrane lipoprotein-sorting protein